MSSRVSPLAVLLDTNANHRTSALVDVGVFFLCLAVGLLLLLGGRWARGLWDHSHDIPGRISGGEFARVGGGIFLTVVGILGLVSTVPGLLRGA
jgi:hypothetical protein